MLCIGILSIFKHFKPFNSSISFSLPPFRTLFSLG
ncbi:hypothetical protein F383_07633 [Gossypium arboreum]|uniref:Uncharacterized protein n=1 Tax=Gossypium arboreum TaxID=29729 RepID=A0A0B0P0L9_GOSAR|nr:hypothetical protein F383_07633 [Gossypium arboreum]